MSLDGSAVLTPVFLLHKRNLEGGKGGSEREDRQREERGREDGGGVTSLIIPDYSA